MSHCPSVRSRWLDIGWIFFSSIRVNKVVVVVVVCVFIDRGVVYVHIRTRSISSNLDLSSFVIVNNRFNTLH